MTKDEALKLAQEELENCADLLKMFEAPIDSCVGATMLRAEAAITAIKQALAAPVQEPVTWRNAAIRVGEDLCSVGPFGYYDMTAQQWLDWALSVVTVHAPPRPPAPVQEQDGPITEGWNINFSNGHSGLGVYAHMDEYPEEGAILLCGVPKWASDAMKATSPAAQSADPDPLHLSRILHELAGATSMCWTPRPTGVFDSQEAIKHVVAAIDEIRARYQPPPAAQPVPVQKFDAWWESAVKTLDVSDDHDAYIGARAAWNAAHGIKENN